MNELDSEIVVMEHCNEIDQNIRDCDIDAGVGYIFGSSKAVRCLFRQTNGATGHYSGRLAKFDFDIGLSGNPHLKWIVVSTADHSVGNAALDGQSRDFGERSSGPGSWGTRVDWWFT